MDIKEVAAKYSDYQIKMRRYFHAHPELSRQESNTSAVVKKELDSIGVSWKKCGLENGVLATIKGAKPGKTILIRGDMDALPVKEETGLPFASENEGVMAATSLGSRNGPAAGGRNVKIPYSTPSDTVRISHTAAFFTGSCL